MDTQNNISIENPNVNNEAFDELEALRKNYNALKEKLDKQEIVNDTILKRTFSAKVRNIHSIGISTVLLGVLVIILSPLAFHYNPAWNLSWAFVAGTDIMMLFCMFKTWQYHFHLSKPRDGEDLVKFAGSVKEIRDKYKNWIKYAFGMIAVWFTWMAVETFTRNDDKMAVFILISAIIGAIIGGAIGLYMDHKVIRNCDEIIADIETLNE